MCGIGGILRTDGRPIPEEWLDAIDARIAYRGPDGQGRFRDRVEVDTPQGKKTVEVAFVHRRLSIIDHADGGQPMVSERGRNEGEGLVAVVFNGCIYNHRKLRRELEAAGHRFATDHSDTEVLIHGHRQWGEQLCDHLEGMYAFAVWDRNAAAVTLARDWFGEKPLHFTAEPQGCWFEFEPVRSLVFASDAGAFPRIDAGSESDDVEGWITSWAGQYLQLGYAATRVHARVGSRVTGGMNPASAALFATKDESVYLNVAGPPLRGVKRAAAHEPLEVLIENAVSRRLEADVPLGCFLSGGVDSSLITHFAKKHKPDLRTFSVKMPDPRYDESQHAEQVAAHIGTDHTTLGCDPKPAEDLVYLINILGEPFGDSSILPTYWVSRAAREHVKVAIAGDGGDELFIGYERYSAARTLRAFWWLFSIVPSALFYRFHPKTKLHKLGRLGDMARDYPRLSVLSMVSLFTRRQIQNLTRLDSATLDLEEGGFQRDALSELRDSDLADYLPDDLLRKVDTASMACALEVRCPFLDRDLAAAVLAMPIDDLIPGGKRKGLLRNIARKYLPAEVVDRPKMGFAIPIGEWFRSDYGSMKTLLLDHLQSAEPFGPISLNRKAVRRFIDEHMSGKRDHGQRLFALLTLSIWARSL
jgi:asparagine synthase (glutamine-hydrolysing)